MTICRRAGPAAVILGPQGMAAGGSAGDRREREDGDRVSSFGAGLTRAGSAGASRRDPFAVAARHSRRVRLLRRLIPVAVVAALLLLLAISIFNPWRMLAKLPIDVGNLVISGTKITMEAPRLAGYTPDRRAYEVSAHAAAQDLKTPDFVELETIHAKVELEDKTVVQMDAAAGLYDAKKEVLTLNRSIELQASNGYAGKLTEAVVDIRKGTLMSTKPVAIKLLNGDLNANNLEILDTGALVRFGGGVTMNLMLDGSSMPGAAKESGKP